MCSRGIDDKLVWNGRSGDLSQWTLAVEFEMIDEDEKSQQHDPQRDHTVVSIECAKHAGSVFLTFENNGESKDKKKNKPLLFFFLGFGASQILATRQGSATGDCPCTVATQPH
jgi:hypothetical protein